MTVRNFPRFPVSARSIYKANDISQLSVLAVNSGTVNPAQINISAPPGYLIPPSQITA